VLWELHSSSCSCCQSAALAFTGDKLGRPFRDYFVTVGEFKAMLAQLDANGWTLVDIRRVVAGTVRVPAGRKPLVLSEALDPSGAVKVQGPKPLYGHVVSTGAAP
jgi:hypothetical protein